MKKFTQILKDRSNISIIMIFAGVFGFLFALCVFFENLFLGLTSVCDNQKGDFFNNNPNYMIWFAAIMVQPPVWALLLFPASAIISRLKKELNERHIWISFLLMIAAIAIFVGISRFVLFSYFKNPPEKSLFVNEKPVVVEKFIIILDITFNKCRKIFTTQNGYSHWNMLPTPTYFLSLTPY